jgi:hypothetical protein
MKHTLKLASIALALPLMLTTLGQAQQWSGQQDLGGFPNSVPYAIQVPGTNVLQIFYQGTDNGLWTLWRNPADGSTPPSWSSPHSLGGDLSSPSSDSDTAAAPIAIKLPGMDVLQVFYRGSDNALWTLWRNPPDGSTPPSWSSPHRLGGQLGGDPAVTQIPGTDVIQVFYRGSDNALWTLWRNPPDGSTPPSWSSPQRLGGSLFTRTCNDQTDPSCYGTSALPVPIQIPNSDDLEVFYRGSNNHLQAFRRNPNGRWTPQDFGGNLAGNPSAAPVPGLNQIEVFYQGGGECTWTAYDSIPTACEASSGGLMTQWGNLSSWTGETRMAGQLQGYYCGPSVPVAYDLACEGWYANYAVPKAYTQPGTNDMFVIYRGADGGVWYPAPTLWGQVRTPDGTWHPEFHVGGSYAPGINLNPSDVTYAQVPGTDTTQIFYTGSTNSVDYNVLTQWTTP